MHALDGLVTDMSSQLSFSSALFILTDMFVPRDIHQAHFLVLRTKEMTIERLSEKFQKCWGFTVSLRETLKKTEIIQTKAREKKERGKKARICNLEQPSAVSARRFQPDETSGGSKSSGENTTRSESYQKYIYL